MEMFSDISWPAVAVGTIVYCAFCGIWHRPFAFGKKWEEAMGFTRPDGWKETGIYYVVPLISCFITTVAIAVFLNLADVQSVPGALAVGLVAGIGFAMAIVFTAGVIPIMKKPLVFGAITGTAQALGIIITTLIVYFISM